LRRVHT